MRRTVTIAVVAGTMLLLLAVLSSACGETQAGEARWEAVPLPLGGGHSTLTYDAQRDVIWILNWSFVNASGRFNDSAATLVRFEPQSRKYQTYTLEGPTDGMGLDAGLAIDRQGFVWAAWGRRLIRVDPATGETKEWIIPQPELGELAGQDPILDGMAVEVAPGPDGRIWAALAYSTVALALDPATGVWAKVDTSPLMAIERSKLSFADVDRLLLNGAIKDDPAYSNVPGGASAMVSIDTSAGKAALSGAAAFAYWPRSDGAMDYVNSDTGAVRALAVEGGDIATSARFGLDRLDPIRQVMNGDGKGELWLWQSGELRLDVIRLDATAGEMQSYAFPLVVSEWSGRAPLTADRSKIPDKVAASPEIQGLVVDNRGDVWIVSGSSAYPPLYRLHVEQP